MLARTTTILFIFALAAFPGPGAAPPQAVTQARQITLALHEGTSMAAALSPDGRTLAVDLLGSLWTLPATGGTARRITDEYMDARQPVWAPDNQRLAFQAYREGTWHIWAVNADGSTLTALTSGPFDDREPSWSPDGSRVAFSSDRSGNYDIWELESGTGTLRQLTHNSANDFAPAWSPNGPAIAFVSDRNDGRGVWTVDTNTGAETIVAPALGSVNAPSWSPDGSRVIYTVIAQNESRLMLDGRAITSHEDVFPFRAQWASPDELIYTADGKIKKRSIRTGQVEPIEFSATVSFTRTPYQLKRRDFNSRAARPVRGIMAPVLSPDGKQVSFAAMTITPTLGIQGWFPIALARDPSRIADPRFRTLFPSWVVSDMDRLARNARPEELAAREAAMKPYGKTVVDVVRGGGRVLAGTDSPIFPYALAFHTELELFVESGLTPFEALQTATTNAAEALGEGANLGSIEPGKLADLVVVSGDPLTDIKNARKVRFVIENGEVFGLEDLLKP